MASHNITRTQRAAILSAIQQQPLDPNDFDWTEEPSRVVEVARGREPFTVEVLVHRPTGYWFQFDVTEAGSLWAIRVPGPEGSTRRDHAGTWQYVWSYLLQWIRAVKEEHETPDLWAELPQQPELTVGEAIENTPFTPEEQQQIAARLTEAKEYVRANLELEDSQLDRVERQLDYLIEAASRSRRVDWRNLVYGALISLVLEAVVPVGPVQHLWTFLIRGLADLFGGGGSRELPGAPPELT